MKKTQIYYLLIFLFISISICFGNNNYTNEITIKNINYSIYKNEIARVIQGNYKGNVIIPKEIKYQGKTYPVTQIGFEAFKNSTQLISVQLPESILEIGSNAFENCSNLKNIQLPLSLEKIHESAFLKCKNLNEIIIPKNISLIEENAFSYCESLSNIIVDEKNQYFSSLNGVLYDKNYLTLIKVPENTLSYTFPNTVIKINSDSFNNCKNLTLIEIPEKVTNIPNNAFENCIGLTKIYLHKNIDFIGFKAFSTCFNLEEIIVDQENKYYVSIDGLLYTNDKSKLIHCPAQKSKVRIDSNTQIINSYAFYNCKNLEEIIFPENVKFIQSPAFVLCDALTSIKIESNEPVKIYSDAFINVMSKATVWVKKETLEHYRNSNIAHIKELNLKGF